MDLRTAKEVSTPEAQDICIEYGERAGWLAPILLEPRNAVAGAEKSQRTQKGVRSL